MDIEDINITPLKMEDTSAFQEAAEAEAAGSSSPISKKKNATTVSGSASRKSRMNANDNIDIGDDDSVSSMEDDALHRHNHGGGAKVNGNVDTSTPLKSKRSRNTDDVDGSDLLHSHDRSNNGRSRYRGRNKRNGMDMDMDMDDEDVQAALRMRAAMNMNGNAATSMPPAPISSPQPSSRANVNTRNASESQSQYQKRKKKSILNAYPMHPSSSDSSRLTIIQLKTLYKTKLAPIESKHNLYNFCLPTHSQIHDSEFDSKPMVLLIGQYSTGKTTFIRHLVGGDYPSMHIGPEPTTDRFTALIHGDDDEEEEEVNDEDSEHELESDSEHEFEDDYTNASTFATDMSTGLSIKTNPKNILTKRWKKDGVNKSSGKTIKGNSLTVMPELPFRSLAAFGSGFLSHFVGSVSPAPLLEHVTLIDTPGVLSGEKQRLSRSYDFAKASRWFADRSDLILLLFDAHKLDISDELKEVIETIRPHNDDKIRCVLNKADGVTREQLVRVYGSLMWSMGKIFHSPEVVRVFTGSYWDEPLVHDDFQNMFESDEWLLIHELINLPKSCAERKVNEVVKRVRIVKVHVCILTYLKNQMPSVWWPFGRKKIQDSLLENLEEVFELVRIEYKLSAGDFPDVNEFARCLEEVEDFRSLVPADKKTLEILDELVETDIPKIMKGTSGISDPFSPRRRKNAGSTSTPMRNKTPSKRSTRKVRASGKKVSNARSSGKVSRSRPIAEERTDQEDEEPVKEEVTIAAAKVSDASSERVWMDLFL